MFNIHTESADDIFEVEYLYDLAFAPGRGALSSYRLREGVEPVAELCLVARDSYDTLAGAIRYWPVLIGEAGHRALLLGPVAVHPTHQGEGLGAELVGESLRLAVAAGWQRALLIGDEPYYRRLGFSRAEVEGVCFPPPTNPERLLGRALVSDSFKGVMGMVRPAIAPTG